MADEEFSAFYAATYPRLLGQLVLLCGDRAEAEDACRRRSPGLRCAGAGCAATRPLRHGCGGWR